MPHPRADFEYNDEYATCVETYSTLRVFSDDIGPDRVTDILGFEPTQSFRKGEPHGTHGHIRKSNGWFLTTEGRTDSKDTRRHIDEILSSLEGKLEAVNLLKRQGCAFDICSYFVSVGQGGPSLWPHQMKQLGDLGIEVWWDVYFSREDEA